MKSGSDPYHKILNLVFRKHLRKPHLAMLTPSNHGAHENLLKWSFGLCSLELYKSKRVL